MNRFFQASLLVSLVLITACTPFWRKGAWSETPAASAPMGPVVESWCYRTLAAIECYPEPQRLPPESLVSVDPLSRRPATREDYAKALSAAQSKTKSE